MQFFKKAPKVDKDSSEETYKEKRDDTDFIHPTRQGYIYFHLKKVYLKI